MQTLFFKRMIFFLVAFAGLQINAEMSVKKQKQYLAQTQKMVQQCAPENTVIAVDMYKVLGLLNLSKILSIARRDLVGASLGFVTYLYTRKMDAFTACKEGQMERIGSKRPFFKRGLRPFIDMAATYDLNTFLLDDLYELKKKGYKIYLTTNIGPKTLKKINEEWGGVFDNLFDGYMNSAPENGWISKPDPLFYKECERVIKATNLDKNIEYVVLIDHRLDSCMAARKYMAENKNSLNWIPYLYRMPYFYKPTDHASFKSFLNKLL